MAIVAFIMFSCFCFGRNIARTSVIDTALTGLSYGSEAIVVSGGWPSPETYPGGVSVQVEMIIPKTGQFCSLPSLPFGTAMHSMNGLTLCGGLKFCENCSYGDMNENCLKFSDGEWSLSNSLLHPRGGHSGWQTENGIFLIGGNSPINDSEFAPSNGEPDYPAFPLEYEISSSCSITDVASHSVILTGGAFFLDGNNYDTTNKVSRYNEDGLVEYMPSLLVGRWRHGCGSFIRDDGNQVLLVAGGLLSDWSTSMSSTEVLVQGSDTWTLATPLPSARNGLAGVTIENRLYITGGGTDEILEWRDDEQIWGLGVWMETGRTHHAASSVTIDDNIMKYCL